MFYHLRGSGGGGALTPAIAPATAPAIIFKALDDDSSSVNNPAATAPEIVPVVIDVRRC